MAKYNYQYLSKYSFSLSYFIKQIYCPNCHLTTTFESDPDKSDYDCRFCLKKFQKRITFVPVKEFGSLNQNSFSKNIFELNPGNANPEAPQRGFFLHRKSQSPLEMRMKSVKNIYEAAKQTVSSEALKKEMISLNEMIDEILVDLYGGDFLSYINVEYIYDTYLEEFKFFHNSLHEIKKKEIYPFKTENFDAQGCQKQFDLFSSHLEDMYFYLISQIEISHQMYRMKHNLPLLLDNIIFKECFNKFLAKNDVLLRFNSRNVGVFVTEDINLGSNAIFFFCTRCKFYKALYFISIYKTKNLLLCNCENLKKMNQEITQKKGTERVTLSLGNFSDDKILSKFI
jgi:hypothetical protein